jgi:phosphoglycolate phosphatase-like HAD superfamily hydrolase
MQKRNMRIERGAGVIGRRLEGPARWADTVIGVDCDGVLASDRLLWQRMRQRFPEHIPARYEDLETFEWPRATEETTALCLELSADPLFMALLEPMPRMVRALGHLRDEGYRIHVITARPECVRRATWRWLRRHGVAEYVDNVHCVEGGLAKIPLARKLGCAAFVEDNYATAEALGATGIRSYLLDAPYNRLPTDHSIRVQGWRALLDDLTLHVPARQPALHLAGLVRRDPFQKPVAPELAS